MQNNICLIHVYSAIWTGISMVSMYDDNCATLNSHISGVFEDKSTNLTFYELQDVLE